MRRAISTYVHVRERLHSGLLDGLVRGGAQAIEIFAARSHFDYTDSQQVSALGNWFRSTEGVEFHSMHSPIYADAQWGRSGSPPLNIVAAERKDRIAAMDEIKRAVEVAEKAPFRYLVQHIGGSNENFSQRKFDDAMTSVEHLRAFARPLGVLLLLENIPNELTTAEKLEEFIRTSRFEDVGVCFDFGHAHICGGVRQNLEPLLPFVRSTHVHDNLGEKDEHLAPGDGSIDWPEAMELLRTAPQVPPLLLEIAGDPNGSLEFSRKVPEVVSRVWEKLRA